MSRLTLEQAMRLPATTLADQPATALFAIKQAAADRLAVAKAGAEHIESALAMKYAQRAQTQRLAAGKDTGVVHFDDGAVRVTADLPKKVDWDQLRLAEIVARIQADGGDPSEYVETIYRVPETKYQAWPAAWREVFDPARTLKPGKPGFRLALLAETVMP